MKLSNTQVNALRIIAIGNEDSSYYVRDNTLRSLERIGFIRYDFMLPELTPAGTDELRRRKSLPNPYYVNISYPIGEDEGVDFDFDFNTLIESQFEGLAYRPGLASNNAGCRDLGYIVEKSILQHFKSLARDYFKQERIPIRIDSWKHRRER
jgi:hypothetical protein